MWPAAKIDRTLFVIIIAVTYLDINNGWHHKNNEREQATNLINADI